MSACKSVHPVSSDLDLRCCGMEGHEPPHYWMKVWSDPDPEPLPEWRRLVDDASGLDVVGGYALGEVLGQLQRLAYARAGRNVAHLARIVAICEQQVGDGWQADPDQSYRDGMFHVLWLIDSLGSWQASDENRWKVLGNRAADWLHTLTEDAS